MAYVSGKVHIYNTTPRLNAPLVWRNIVLPE